MTETVKYVVTVTNTSTGKTRVVFSTKDYTRATREYAKHVGFRENVRVLKRTTQTVVVKGAPL